MPYPQDRPHPPPHVIHALVHGMAAGQQWANVFWLRNGAADTPVQGDMTAIAVDIGETWWDAFGQHVPTGVDLAGCQILYYDETEIFGGADVGTPHSGNAGVEGLPNNTATCISWKVQARYKGGHPRTYLPPTDIANRLDGRLYKPAYTADVAGKANSFHATLNSLSRGNMHDLHLGTVSFVLRRAWRTPPIFRDFVPGEATVDQRIDSMRRRLGRDL